MESKVHYRHLRGWDNASGITVAFSCSENKVFIGFSFCSPKEKSFVKAKGRELALKRLENEKERVVMDITYFSKCLFNNGIQKVIKSFAKKNHISWVQKHF